MPFPQERPRRLRSRAAVRALVRETQLSASQLMLPLFVVDGMAEPRPIASMPGVVQHTRDSARRAIGEAAELGLGGVMLFGVPAQRDAAGSAALDPEGILPTAIRDAKAEAGDHLVVMSDLCLDEYTDHGHCGLLDSQGRVDNDLTLASYAQMAVVHAESGVDFVGTSGMMDGQVGTVRTALDAAGHADTAILAYAAKYASAFYGPFRDAVESTLQGDRRTYQQDPANAREGLREVRLDVAEGADVVMVKPALGYLDIVSKVRWQVDVPVAAYCVSGELAMVEAAAERGWIDRDAAIDEALLSIRRAGADIVVTYWAAEYARRHRTI